MTKEELAAKLNGREYLHEITDVDEQAARDSRLLVIFGASDDLVELRGAINDEVGACDGAEFFVSRAGKLLCDMEDEEADVLRKFGVLEAAQARYEAAVKIKALWCEGKYSWSYKTNAPHATFEIVEDEKLNYCRGIVIDLKELQDVTTTASEVLRASSGSPKKGTGE